MATLVTTSMSTEEKKFRPALETKPVHFINTVHVLYTLKLCNTTEQLPHNYYKLPSTRSGDLEKLIVKGDLFCNNSNSPYRYLHIRMVIYLFLAKLIMIISLLCALQVFNVLLL